MQPRGAELADYSLDLEALIQWDSTVLTVEVIFTLNQSSANLYMTASIIADNGAIHLREKSPSIFTNRDLRPSASIIQVTRYKKYLTFMEKDLLFTLV
ncbi:hypothetical protein J6590_057338 [Homalodisca vitripennis]|nr:hypothetical protein J6590_057338 [Homalodisca vitripennis]